MQESNRNYTLDLIRGVSALIVLMSHLRAAMFLDFNQLDLNVGTGIIAKVFYFITGLGHQAVMVFFVLSGYFVGGSILKLRKKFTFKKYLIARLSRLWTPLIPILFFTLFIDYFLNILFPEIISGNYYDILNSGPTTDYSNSIITFISNILFLQTTMTPVYGSNGPLWSLAYEFWYYIIFPLIAIVVGVIPSSVWNKIISIIFIILISVTVSTNMLQGFLIWMLGVGVYYITTKNNIKTNTLFITIFILFFVVSLIHSKFHFFNSKNDFLEDLFVGLAFSGLLISIINYQLPKISFLNLRKLSFGLSEISYTLYILHFPLVLLIYGIFYIKDQEVFSVSSLLQFFAWSLFLIIVSALFWYLFERNTNSVRQFMIKIFK
ncbi:acyltransferase family protein [Maribacter dokdonensis]|uniref:acyltransferase family protein n=1 Tax=Maribacter dokdonensis TaxID=320912 RepID=UPI0007199044|nr:acyltransferase [Maribacter dokdonensis]KSA15221.1 Acyltransferase 3 [Maribacter dokdonensis DSW-8]